MSIRVGIADDQELIRALLADVLAREDGFTVLGVAADGEEAVALALRTVPDVMLMDIQMPHVDGIEATRRIRATPPLAAMRVLMLTTFEDADLVEAALRAGADGFIGKTQGLDRLVEAIRLVQAGEAMLSPRATRAIVDRYTQGPAHGVPDPRLASLTEREREIVALVGKGLDNDAIASLLSIAPATAKTHVNRAMAKLVVHDRSGLVVRAHELGLVEG
ncbi:MAG: response regulator transcription factor [Bifidobacteriaceae bacterium]|jgi:DNA-binding NarL/FixJ family response regulator|nr:response regulator transcription factor [Bifidobacteriaceae bacterium]